MCYKLPLCLLLICCSTLLTAQQELGLHFLSDVLQSNKTNPAFTPEENLVIGLPNVHFQFFHTSGTINDLLDTSPDTASNLDVGNWISLLQGNNKLNANIELETFRIFYRVGKLGLSLNHAAKFNTDFRYSDNYVRLLGEGNAQFAGETIDFGPRIQQDIYNEFGLGLAYPINDKIKIGARVKYLSGIGNISTGDQSNISLFTDEDIYQISVDSDYELRTTEFINYTDTSFFDLNYPENYGLSDLFTSNNGFAFDLGIDWKVSDKLQISASIVDIGKINWKDNATSYTSNGKENFEGLVIDFPSILRGEIASFSNNIDTIDFNNLFNFEQNPVEYSSTIPAKLYLSAQYQINDRLRVGALYLGEFYLGEQQSAFGVNLDAKINKILSVGGSYSYRFESLDNLGLNVRLKLGPVQVFAITDNVLGVIRPYSSANTNGRFGINCLFGKPSKESEAITLLDN
jgi:Outer membrane protein transport protein (OMPP1/FadL/TodX).